MTEKVAAMRRPVKNTIGRDIVVPVPEGVADWASSDHSLNIAILKTKIEEEGFTFVSAEFVEERPNPESPYNSCVLHYRVEVMK